MQFIPSLLLVLLLLLSYFSEVLPQGEEEGDYFSQFERHYLQERARQAAEVLQSDIEPGMDRLKEIEITCPGEVPPLVQIRDLVEEASFSTSSRKECQRIRLKGKNFNFRLSLFCDNEDEYDYSFG